MFKLRKYEWLSHGQQGKNCACPSSFFSCLYYGIYKFSRTKAEFWLQIYGCPCLGRMDNQNFIKSRVITYIYHVRKNLNGYSQLKLVHLRELSILITQKKTYKTQIYCNSLRLQARQNKLKAQKEKKKKQKQNTKKQGGGLMVGRKDQILWWKKWEVKFYISCQILL